LSTTLPHSSEWAVFGIRQLNVQASAANDFAQAGLFLAFQVGPSTMDRRMKVFA
jgi:hypothetical protein